MKKPTKKEIQDYERNIRFNGLFRDADSTLAATLLPNERVVVMTLVWPAVKRIAVAVMGRTISDLTNGGR